MSASPSDLCATRGLCRLSCFPIHVRDWVASRMDLGLTRKPLQAKCAAVMRHLSGRQTVPAHKEDVIQILNNDDLRVTEFK